MLPNINLHTVIVGNIETNCYIVETKSKNALIVDPGAEGDKILSAVKSKGLTPTKILLTHGHHDHIGAIKEIKAVYPDVEVMIGEFDAEMLSNVALNLARIRYITTERFDGLKEDIRLKDGDIFKLDELEFKVIHTPGHTKGGIATICSNVIFTGDTIFKDTVGRTDLPGGSYDQILSSVARLAELSDDYVLLCGHGEATTLSREKRYNQFFLM